MKNSKRFKRIPAYLFVAVVSTACGGSAATYGTGATAAATTSNLTFPTPLPSPTSSTTSGNAPFTYSFTVSGAGGTNPTFTTNASGSTFIGTDNLLTATVTAGSASNTYSTYTAVYNCITYTVSAYDQNGNLLQSQTTGTLAVAAGNAGCTSAPTSQALDFSSIVSSGSHGGVYFTVQADDYDFYCQLWYSYYYAYGSGSPYYEDYNSFCPMKAVYKTHSVTGTLAIQTNGTS